MRTVTLALILAACTADHGAGVDTATTPGGKALPGTPPADPPRLRWADPSFTLPKPADPAAVARAFLSREADALHATQGQLARVDVDDVLTLPGGASVVRMSLLHDGLPVVGSRLAVLLGRDSRPVAWSLGPAWTAPLGGAATAAPSRGPEVLRAALAEAHDVAPDALGVSLGPAGPGGWRAIALVDRRDTLRLDSGRARPCWYPRAGALEAAWEVETDLRVRGRREAARRLVSDRDASELGWRDLVAHAPTWRVWATPGGLHVPLDGPHGDASPHPTGMPDGTAPAPVLPADVVFAGLPTHPGGTVEPWLSDDATELTGNHAEAYADRASPDGFGAGDVRPIASVPGLFTWDYDLLAEPTADGEQAAASATHAYYVVNWLHDWYYGSGFDEARGNAQADNHGRGGLAGDRMRVEVQDGIDAGSLNNANMTTPADGSSPRMQIFVWSGLSENRLTVDGIANPLAVRTASFGPQDFEVSGPLRALPAAETLACAPLATDLTGQVVLVHRGSCTFVQKATHVQAAGGIAMIVVNNTTGLIGMSGTDPAITIPSLSVGMADGATLAALLDATPGAAAQLYRREDPDIDGALDTTVVAHEWGHYLHHRLVECSTTACRGMSEGWSDFVALHLAMREGDDPRGAYAVGAWSMQGRDPDALYYGVRRTAYSADRALQPLRFRHLSDGEPLPPPPFLADSTANSAVHNAGEVWAGMLFDAYVALHDAHPARSFEQTQRRMSDLVVASMALSPPEPTHLEARDALLAAAWALAPDDATTLAAAFASRGMGTCAVGPARTSPDLRGVVEDDSVRAVLRLDAPELVDGPDSCDDDGVLDRGETATLRMRVRNEGPIASDPAWIEVGSDTPGVEAWPARVDVGALPPFQDTFVDVEVHAARAVPAGAAVTLAATLHTVDTCTDVPNRVLGTTVEHDIAPHGAVQDGFEVDAGAWTLDGIDASAYWRRTAVATHDTRWVGASAPRAADVRLRSPVLRPASDAPLRLGFRHRHRFEADATANWDGAVLEAQLDGGPWTPLPDDVDPTAGRIEWDSARDAVRTTATNPLAGRRAWVGTNAAWPALETVVIDFGTRWAHRDVRFRWRLGSDQSVALDGWDIDDVWVEGVTGGPFPVRVADATACNDRPPVADAGPDAEARTGEVVTLDGSGSHDPDGDTLAHTWSQLDGPAVALSSTGTTVTFVAPEVDAPAPIRLQLVASDGELDAQDTVDILVRPANRAPRAAAGPDVTVTAGEVVTLDGSASYDPDGDALLGGWSLIAEPPVAVLDASSLVTSFVAPEVDAPTDVQAFLDVSDGALAAQDSRVVHVVPRNGPPQVELGEDLVVRSGDWVNLDATGAWDPDGDVLTFAWTLAGADDVVLERPSEGSAGFRAPDVDAPRTLSAHVTVSDGIHVAQDSLVFLVRPRNRPPVAVAGEDRTVEAGAPVVLDASGCVDADGDTLTFGWSVTGADGVAIEDPSAPVTLLHAPATLVDLVLDVTLHAHDGFAATSDTFRLSVRAASTDGTDTGSDAGHDTAADTGHDAGTGTAADTGHDPDTATPGDSGGSTGKDTAAYGDEPPGLGTDTSAATLSGPLTDVDVNAPGSRADTAADPEDGTDAPTTPPGAGGATDAHGADPDGCGCGHAAPDAVPAGAVVFLLGALVTRRRRA